jgi:F0F1-type ATP synthase epsilon subunit
MRLLFYPTMKGLFKMKKIALRASALVLFVALAAGCATTGLDDIKATADRAAADAAAAASAAEAARAAADRAAQAASSAQSTADQALSAATDAQSCCDANRESMERMFKKSMSK